MSKDQPQSDLHTCVNCGHAHSGLYCNQCGEKIIIPREKTLVFFLQQVVNAFTFADTKLIKSLKMIVTNPGSFSLNYTGGRRVSLMRPMNLFLLCNLIYFLFPVVDTFNTSLNTQMYHLPSSKVFNVEERVNQMLVEASLTLEEYRTVYDAASSSNSKILLILLVFFFSIGFLIFGYRKKEYFIDHLMFAFEYGIFFLFVNTILLGYLLFAVVFTMRALGGEVAYLSEFYLSTIVSITSLYFLIRGMKKFYGHNWPLSVLFGLLVFLWSFASVQAYRWVLFEVSFASV